MLSVRAVYVLSSPQLDAFQEYIERLEPAKEQLLHQILTSIAAKNVHAVIWRRLLYSGAKCPLTVGFHLRELLWQIPILTARDTTQPAGAVLQSIFEHLSEEERARIETAILAIPPHMPADGEPDYRLRDRLLGYLPLGAIVTSQARDIRESLATPGGPPPDVPFFENGQPTCQFARYLA